MNLFLLFVFFLVLLGAGIDLLPGWTWYDQQRAQQIALIYGASLFFFPHKQKLPTCVWNRQVWQAGAPFLLLGLVPAWFARQPRYAMLEWATFALLMMLALRLAEAVRLDARSVGQRGLVLLAGVGTALTSKIMVGYGAALAEDLRLDTLLLFESAFSNRRFFGQLATLLIPMFAWAIFVNRRFAMMWFGLLMAWWMLLYVSGTRGSWVALAGAHLALFVWTGARAWPWMRVQFAAAGLGLLAYWLLFYLVPGWLGMETGVENRLDNLSTLSAREVIWGLAWHHAVENPWLGIGPMHFAAYPNPVAAHPHNAVLQLAAEWGFPAALAAMVMVGYGLWAFVRPLRQEGDVLRLALAVSLLGALVQSMVDGMIVIPYTQTWLALITGLALGVHWHGRVCPPPALPWVWGVRGATLLALAALLYGAFPEILNRADATAVYLETHDSLAPRYWAQGWIR